MLPLTSAHQHQMDESGIPAALVAMRGYASLSGSLGYDRLRALGFTQAQSSNLPGLLLPVWGTDGQCTDLAVYRPDSPRLSDHDTPRKYELPRGQGMRLDCHPQGAPRLGDPTVPLWITEGQKKGDALTARGACAIALLGVDCWRGKNPQGGSTALADWDAVHLRDRAIHIVFDSDVVLKPQVKGALRRLSAFLKAKHAVVDAVILPPLPEGHKQGIDDYLAGHTLDGALALAIDPWQDQPTDEEALAASKKAGLPQIRVIPGELSALIVAAEQAILAWQQTHPPVLFQRAGQLCFIVRDLASPTWLQRPPDLPHIQIATLHKLRALCNETAAWYRWNERLHGWKLDVPPLNIVQTLLDKGEWGFPPLQGMATRPFFRPDGTLCQTPGYDPATGVSLELPPGWPSVVLPPTLDIFTAQSALRTLRALLSDFPFANPAQDFAATLAALLTLIARPAIDGQVPLCAITSSTPGSGKGLLADLLCIVATGDCAPRWAPTHEQEEERKRLMTIALSGEQVAMIDNIQGDFGSEALDMAITSGVVHDRALGSHGHLTARLTTMFFATGNNVTFRGDMARRLMPVGLQPTTEHPETRDDFTIPHIRRHCREHQHDYLQAATIILAAFLASGAPLPPAGRGSFEEWNGLIRGAVMWATGEDPMPEHNTLTPRDPDLDQWDQLLTCWEMCVGLTGRTVGMLVNEIATLRKNGTMDDNWRQLAETLAGLDPRGDGVHINPRVVGKSCAKYRGRIVGGRRMIEGGEHNRAKLWRVVRDSDV